MTKRRSWGGARCATIVIYQEECWCSMQVVCGARACLSQFPVVERGVVF